MKKNESVLLFLAFIYIMMAIGSFMLRNVSYFQDIIMIDALALICGILFVIQECELKIKSEVRIMKIDKRFENMKGILTYEFWYNDDGETSKEDYEFKNVEELNKLLAHTYRTHLMEEHNCHDMYISELVFTNEERSCRSYISEKQIETYVSAELSDEYINKEYESKLKSLKKAVNFIGKKLVRLTE